MRYEIYEDSFDWFCRRIEKLNKKATKMGVQPILVEEVGILQEEENSRIHNKVIIEMRGDAPKYAGWIFVARIQYLKTEVITGTIPGEVLPLKYREAKSTCDHCNKNRHRKDVYIVRKGTEYKQVGRSCLKDFLGHTDPQELADFASKVTWLNDLIDLDKLVDDANRRPRQGWFLPLHPYLATVSMVIRELGWSSKSQSSNTGKPSTSEIAYMLSLKADDSILPAKASVMPEDNELATKAIEWAKVLDPETSNDYEYNIGTIARARCFKQRTAGYAASIIAAYQKYCRQIEEDQKKGKSEFIGVVGERSIFELYLDSIVPIEGSFGTTYMHRFHDQDLNQVVWFGSSEMKKASTLLKIKATVKKHQEYRGSKQTIITRAKEV